MTYVVVFRSFRVQKITCLSKQLLAERRYVYQRWASLALLRTCTYAHNRQVTPEAFMKHIHTVDPDFFGCLSHQLANTSSLKQSSRAVDIALKWLDKCLELHCQHKVFVFLAILI